MARPIRSNRACSRDHIRRDWHSVRLGCAAHDRVRTNVPYWSLARYFQYLWCSDSLATPLEQAARKGIDPGVELLKSQDLSATRRLICLLT